MMTNEVKLATLGGLKVRSAVKAGGVTSVNHGVKVRSAVKAGGVTSVNHGVSVRSSL